MAENTYKSNTFKKPEKEKKAKSGKSKSRFNLDFFADPRFVLASGFFLIIVALFLFIAYLSYIFTGKADQSIVESWGSATLAESGAEVENWLGVAGAFVAHYTVFRWLGISAFFIPPLLFLLGFKMVFKRNLLPTFSIFIFSVFAGLWLSLLLGYITHSVAGVSEVSFLSGGLGYALAVFSDGLFGWGTFLILALTLFVFIIYYFNVTAIHAFQVRDPKPMGTDALVPNDEAMPPTYTDEKDNWPEIKKQEPIQEPVVLVAPPVTEPPVTLPEIKLEVDKPADQADKGKTPTFTVEEPKSDMDELAEQLVEEKGFYDPTLDLSNYRFPPLELLNEYDTGKVQVTQEELNQNKDKIIATLVNFKIGIQSIKATIGPTVTLYEIVPDAGIKISRIKNLEDDIALSLAALGIRIIAPIPGKGTIGIEVPNSKPDIVSMRSLIASEKFQHAEMELPIVLGKTISNETFVTDLTRMPHLLLAGATGQGKSVGLNAILVSLLYKKHPAEIKFVLVDPKKVELTLFNKIERHFLAKLPGEADPIITDTQKVVKTLSSLCVEMENRLELLKTAGCRNIKEYNQKFVERRLNPENGHRYLPYIVLVVDEFADLIMTAGREVETPIARLAQLARAIGIHLIIATQRPSVNIITGVIKANFPARIAFRVTSKIDSRTILDSGGAEQLIGRGDMLFSSGNDLIRIQCGFVDTPEVEAITDYIGAQQGYPEAHLLPEVADDNALEMGNLADEDRDEFFEEAARIIVLAQQGSASLLQRKLKLGYTRAGRLIDQLEATGVIGPFERSKARKGLIPDELSLEQFLKSRASDN